MVTVVTTVMAAMMATKVTAVMTTEVTTVMTAMVTVVMTEVVVVTAMMMVMTVMAMAKQDMAKAMAVTMPHLDCLVLRGDRGGRQRRCDTGRKADKQSDGRGNRGQHCFAE